MDLFAVADGAGHGRASLFFLVERRIYCASLTSPGNPADICAASGRILLSSLSFWIGGGEAFGIWQRHAMEDVTIRRPPMPPQQMAADAETAAFSFGAGDDLARLVSSHLFRLPLRAAHLFCDSTIKEKSAAAAVVRTNSIGAHLHAAIVSLVCSAAFTFRSRTK
jgi:hypothetical protein